MEFFLRAIGYSYPIGKIIYKILGIIVSIFSFHKLAYTSPEVTKPFEGSANTIQNNKGIILENTSNIDKDAMRNEEEQAELPKYDPTKINLVYSGKKQTYTLLFGNDKLQISVPDEWVIDPISQASDLYFNVDLSLVNSKDISVNIHNCNIPIDDEENVRINADSWLNDFSADVAMNFERVDTPHGTGFVAYKIIKNDSGNQQLAYYYYPIPDLNTYAEIKINVFNNFVLSKEDIVNYIIFDF